MVLDGVACGIKLIIFGKAAFSQTERSEAFDKLKRLNPFNRFKSEFEFIAKAKGGAMAFRKNLPIHFVSENGLVVLHMFDFVAIIVEATTLFRTVGKGVKTT